MTETSRSYLAWHANKDGSVTAWVAEVKPPQRADVMDATQSLNTFSQWGPWGLVTALLFAALIAVVRGYWVPGSYYTAMKSERDLARQDASESTKTLERLTAGWKPPQ